MTIRELQLQGLVGPTHNYAGLGLGNLASQRNADQCANPRAAALQSLELMRYLHELDVPVMIMPPQTRPRLDVLCRLGFKGAVSQQLEAAYNAAPALLRAVWSASYMWTANAATVTPATDSEDGRCHITPANLLSSLHRVLEMHENRHFLCNLFTALPDMAVHPPLPVTTRLADEGAANHMRLQGSDATELLHLFIYGMNPPDADFPALHMPRQTRAASEAVAENHQLPARSCHFFQQQPAAVDAGVFHHDVIGMSHRRVLIMHESALVKQDQQIEAIRAAAPWLDVRIISECELSLQAAVDSYFFNAQLVDNPGGKTSILFPQECQESPEIVQLAQQLQAELEDIHSLHYFDLRESMRNGGGPACLRLRIPLTETQLDALPAQRRFSVRQYQQLKRLIETRYRDRVTPSDLLDAKFAEEALSVQRDLLAIFDVPPWEV